MRIIQETLNGVLLLEPTVHGDHRGFFVESYNREQFAKLGLNMDFVQDNHSLSSEAGTLRGMHYQLAPKAQTKVVRVTAGAIYDVVVDIRRESATFGKWAGFLLSAQNYRQLVVPKGFAHGFCTLVGQTEVMYKVDELYSAENDRGIAWNDPDIGIDWPMSKPILSGKDEQHPRLCDARW